MQKKAPKPKNKKIALTISERDYSILRNLASKQNCAPGIVARRILKEKLREQGRNSLSQGPENQLGLFDSLQIDIFNNTSKTRDK